MLFECATCCNAGAVSVTCCRLLDLSRAIRADVHIGECRVTCVEYDAFTIVVAVVSSVALGTPLF